MSVFIVWLSYQT